MKQKIFVFLTVAIMATPGCQYFAKKPAPETPKTCGTVPFVYYLQNLDAQGLMSIHPGLAVVDPYDSGLTPQEVVSLKNSGITMVAYLSAGEVDPARDGENDGYRYDPAWDDANWLKQVPEEIRTNQNWNSYRVEFWDPGWKELMQNRLNAVIDLGYDGVMFDTVDSFMSLAPHYKQRDVRQDMANLIGDLRAFTQQRKPGFKILINGGMELYGATYGASRVPFIRLIDGQLKEDTWYNESGAINADWTPYDIKLMKYTVSARVPLYSIDYFTDEERLQPNVAAVQDYFKKAKAFGAIPYAADRSLGRFLDVNRQQDPCL